jgi:hypothetical protein
MADTVNRARDETREVAADAAERGKEVTAAVQEQAGAVVHEAAEQARRVAAEAKTQVRYVAEDAKMQLRGQAETQASRLADGLERFQQQGQALLAGDRDGAGQLADYADRALASVGQLTYQLRSRSVDDLVGDLRRYAQRRPGAFLAGAAVLGFVAGRMLRSVRDEEQDAPDYSAFPVSRSHEALLSSTADVGVLTEASYGRG